MNRLPFVLFAAALLGSGLAGCYESNTVDARRSLSTSLEKAADCGDLLERFRADALLKVEQQAATFLEADAAMRASGGGGGWAVDGGFAGVGGGAGGGTAAGGAPPEADAPSRFTDTNTQEAGIDEPDFIKTDGERIFLLHGEQLRVFRSWPAAETAAVGELTVEGSPTSMFLADDKVVIYSTVMFVDETTPVVGSPLPPGMDGAYGCWGPYYPDHYRTFTKMTVLAVDTDTPVVLEERYVEGSLRDARRHGADLRTIVESPTWDPVWSAAQPSSYTDAWELVSRATYEHRVAAWLDERRNAIGARTLDDFLPDELVRDGEQLVSVAPRCGSFYAPEAGQAPYGMAQVLTTSLEDLGTSDSVFVVGAPATVYASDDTLVVTQVDWDARGWGTGSDARTVLHAFALAEGTTRYTASGAVAGTLNNQFSLDEAGGVLRVAVTDNRLLSDSGPDVWAPTSSVNRVVTLRAEGSKLVELGRTPDLAEGERIFSVRYVGDKAYVVTFRSVDPLFVIDLADPAAPTVLGEVKIPGFSTYMHPLDATHLLTIGRAGDGSEGMQLQIFDVSDPTDPRQVQSFVVAGGYSAAEYDHKAFVFDPVSSLLAVPVEQYDTSFSSTLRLFHVSVDEGFTARGVIDHSGLFDGCIVMEGDYSYYGCSYSASMRRGLFIDEYVYAVSYGGITVHPLADVATPVATEKLPEPVFYPFFY